MFNSWFWISDYCGMGRKVLQRLQSWVKIFLRIILALLYVECFMIKLTSVVMLNVFKVFGVLWCHSCDGRDISRVVKTQSNLWLRCILLLLIEPGDWTLACPQTCLCLFSLVYPKRRYCSQALLPLSISYWNNVQNVLK